VAEYPYGSIQKLADNLRHFGIQNNVITRIMECGDAPLLKRDKPARAEWYRGAMERLDRLVDEPTRQAVRRACACCLGGKRYEMVKAIAARHQTLDDRVRAADKAKLVFGHSVTLEDDGRVRVLFAPEGLESYGCPCLPVSNEPMPVSYCYCCAGHAQHHLETALGRKTEVEVVCTALSTCGKKPCTFLFRLVGSPIS